MTKLRKMSEHAMAAAAIRKELKAKFPNIKCRVTSQSFSMGNSVDIYVPRGTECEPIRAVTDKYCYGHFDGMTDCYEYSNKDISLPQAKFVSVQWGY